jgi:ClpP class serine protease
MSQHLHIASAFYGEPWLILPAVHAEIGAILAPRIKSGAIAEDMAAAMQQQKTPAPEGVHIEDGIGFLRMSGVIGKHLSMMESCYGGYDLARYERQMLELMHRDDVHTIVVELDSPGGRAVGVHEIAVLGAEVAEEKRLIGYINTQCASACYYAAAPFTEIYAGESSTVGSIGCYSAFLDQSRALEMDGLKLEVFSTGELKHVGMPGTSLTAGQRKFMQDRVMKLGGKFKAFVQSCRPHVSEAALNGSYMTAEEGLDAGLVDGLYPTLSHMLSDIL